MNTKKEQEFIRVAAQFTIRPNTISLLAEEDHHKFKKGSLVMQVGRSKLNLMKRPLFVEIISKKEKGVERIITKIVLK